MGFVSNSSRRYRSALLLVEECVESVKPVPTLLPPSAEAAEAVSVTVSLMAGNERATDTRICWCLQFGEPTLRKKDVACFEDVSNTKEFALFVMLRALHGALE